MGDVGGDIARNGVKEADIFALHTFHRLYYGYGLHFLITRDVSQYKSILLSRSKGNAFRVIHRGATE